MLFLTRKYVCSVTWFFKLSLQVRMKLLYFAPILWPMNSILSLLAKQLPKWIKMTIRKHYLSWLLDTNLYRSLLVFISSLVDQSEQIDLNHFTYKCIVDPLHFLLLLKCSLVMQECLSSAKSFQSKHESWPTQVQLPAYCTSSVALLWLDATNDCTWVYYNWILEITQRQSPCSWLLHREK